MNARKVIFIMGAILLALVAALVTVALFSHKKMESEKNRLKTEPARRARHDQEKKIIEKVDEDSDEDIQLALNKLHKETESNEVV